MADPPLRNPALHSRNRLKIGLFCTNTISGFSTIPERFTPTWENCLRIACKADAIGLEAVVPIARWKGYLPEADHPSHEVLDTFTYAAAVAQATRQIAVFATTHAPVTHPVFAAKQTATIDHVSGGRFVLNVVGGWNRPEFDMFGLNLLAHEDRYAYLAEWLGLVRRLWTEDTAFDHQSARFTLRGAVSRPRPLQYGGVPIMNAGLSPSGMNFAAAHSDIGLIALYGDDLMSWTAQVSEYKDLARRSFGRELQVWTNVSLVVGRTESAARDYLRSYSEEHVDWASLDAFVATLARENGVPPDSDRYAFFRRSAAVGLGALIVGDPDQAAAGLGRLADAGLDGVIITFVDFDQGLEQLEAEILPRLERDGRRRPVSAETML